MSEETATALVSLSRAMGRRETRIIRRGNSSTSLSRKVLNEQNLFVFLKLFYKINFVSLYEFQENQNKLMKNRVQIKTLET